MFRARARAPVRVALKPKPRRASKPKAKLPKRAAAAVRTLKQALPPPLNVSCPACARELTRDQVLEGFLPSLADTTTSCPNCHLRFQAPWIFRREGLFYAYLTKYHITDAGVQQLCEMQTRALAQRVFPNAFVPPPADELIVQHTNLVVNLMAHWGSVANALMAIFPEAADAIETAYDA